MSYSKEELRDLSERLDEVLDGHSINLCISALMTSLVTMITSTAPSAVEAKAIIEYVHEMVSPEAVQEMWTESNQASALH